MKDEAKMQEQLIKELEERCQALFEASTDAIFLETLGGRILNCNTSACEMFGYAKEELIGLTVSDLVPEEVVMTPPEVIAEELTTGDISVETVNKRKDGSLFPVEVNTRLTTIGGEQLVIAYVRDITERKRAEEALHQEREMLRGILMSMADEVSVVDADFTIQMVNEEKVRKQGDASRPDFGLIGRKCFEIYERRDQVCPNCPIQEAFRSGQPVRGSIHTGFTNTGKTYIAEVSAAPVRDANGQIVAGVEVVRDITERKALEETWRKYEFIVNTSREFMTLINNNYVYEAINESHCKAHNQTREEIVGKTVADIWGEAKFHTIIKAHLDKCFAGNEVHEQVWLEYGALGQRYMDVTYYPYFSEGTVTHAVVVSRDITERMRAEEKIQQRNNELQALHDTSLSITAQLEMPNLLKDITRRAVDLLGAEAGGIYLYDQEREELKLAACYGYTEDYEGVTLKPGEGMAGKVFQNGAPMIVNDYRTWPGRAALYEADQPFTAALEVPLKWQDQVIGVLAVDDAVAKRTFTEDDVWLATLFANQAATAIVNVRLYEESQRAYEELKTAQEQLVQVEKQTAIIEMAGATAHELNQPLTILLGLSALLRRQVGEDHPLYDDLSLIMQNAQRMSKTVKKIGQITRYETKPYVGNVRIVDIDRSAE